MSLSVSIIVPTHDRPEELRRAVASILAQTHLPAELIVVNDGEQDIPAQLAEQARAAGVAFRCERRSPASATASRNLGLSLARGDVIVLGEDDVTYPPDFLHRLVGLYEADPGSPGRIGGIGVRVVEPEQQRFTRRVWDALIRLTAHGRFTPRRWAARYVPLPARLRAQLAPAPFVSAGAMSLRRSAAAHRFEEAFGGYSYAEDIEYSYRVGRQVALFMAPGLAIHHEPAPTGRPDMRTIGRLYVANLLHTIRKSADPGVGTWLLVGYNFASRILLQATVGAVGKRRRQMLAMAAGMSGELVRRAGAALRTMLCGC